jgi:hypothetical protein
MKFEEDEQIGPDFMCDTNGVGGDPFEDKLTVHAHTHRGVPVIAVQVSGDFDEVETWLTRSQVKDLMVVLGYFLHETEDEEEE